VLVRDKRRHRLDLLLCPLALLGLAGCPQSNGPEAAADKAAQSADVPSGPASPSGSHAVAANGLVTTTFAVEGMTCESCSEAIQQKLIGISGVSTVAADHAAAVARVQYDPQKVDTAQLIAAIESLKYKARVQDKTS